MIGDFVYSNIYLDCQNEMYIDWVLFIISILLTSWSFFSILIEWDRTDLQNFYSVWAGVSIAVSVSIVFAMLFYFKKLSVILKHWSYNCWIAILGSVGDKSTNYRKVRTNNNTRSSIGRKYYVRVSYTRERPLCSPLYNSGRLGLSVYGEPRCAKMGDDMGICHICGTDCSFNVYGNVYNRRKKAYIVFNFIGRGYFDLFLGGFDSNYS